MAVDYSKNMWFEAGMWIRGLQDDFEKLEAATEEEKKDFNDLVNEIKGNLCLVSYKGEEFLRDVQKVEAKFQEVRSRLDL
jgi:hypothetical protein